jgi:hypothetical protein
VQPIVDPRTATDRDFGWAEDFEMEPWRSDLFKIPWIGKESENLLPVLW